MSYTLSPEPEDRIGIRDCDEGDRPLEILPDENPTAPAAFAGVGCIGVIGGADGPTVLIRGGSQQSSLRTVCSSLHFEPISDDVEWCMMFSVKEYREETFWLTEDPVGGKEQLNYERYVPFCNFRRGQYRKQILPRGA